LRTAASSESSAILVRREYGVVSGMLARLRFCQSATIKSADQKFLYALNYNIMEGILLARDRIVRMSSHVVADWSFQPHGSNSLVTSRAIFYRIGGFG
jgi:hypothetical protein